MTGLDGSNDDQRSSRRRHRAQAFSDVQPRGFPNRSMQLHPWPYLYDQPGFPQAFPYGQSAPANMLGTGNAFMVGPRGTKQRSDGARSRSKSHDRLGQRRASKSAENDWSEAAANDWSQPADNDESKPTNNGWSKPADDDWARAADNDWSRAAGNDRPKPANKDWSTPVENDWSKPADSHWAKKASPDNKKQCATLLPVLFPNTPKGNTPR